MGPLRDEVASAAVFTNWLSLFFPPMVKRSLAQVAPSGHREGSASLASSLESPELVHAGGSSFLVLGVRSLLSCGSVAEAIVRSLALGLKSWTKGWNGLLKALSAFQTAEERSANQGTCGVSGEASSASQDEISQLLQWTPDCSLLESIK